LGHVTTLHENCTFSYTLRGMLAGTYSVLVPVLQGAAEADPKAPPPMAATLIGMMILFRLVQSQKA
jgi:hypothetical protein